MSLRYLYALVCWLWCFQSLFAQNDTILKTYHYPNSTLSFNNELLTLADGRLIFTNRGASLGYAVFVTDKNGEVLHERILDTVSGFEIKSSSFIFDDGARYVHIGWGQKNDDFYYLSYALDTALNQISLIDSLKIEGENALFFDMIRFNESKNLWEGFGVVQNLIVNQYTKNCYIALDTNFSFTYFKEFQPYQSITSPISDFFYNSDLNRYYVSSFVAGIFILDDSINITYVGRFDIEYHWGGMSGSSILDVVNFEKDQNGDVICYGDQWATTSNFAASFLTLNMQPDTVSIDTIIPVNYPSLDIYNASQMRKDHDGNYILSGMNAWPTSPNLNNQINVIKFSPSLNKLWHFNFSVDTSFIIWDMEIDEYNDIILIGQIIFDAGPNQAQGFMMKINSEGQLTNIKDLPVFATPQLQVSLYPNPTKDEAYIEVMGKEKPQKLRFRDMMGRMIWEHDPVFNLGDRAFFRLPNQILAGTYTVECLFDRGQRIVIKLIVEGN